MLTWGMSGSFTIKFLLFFFPYSVHWKPIIGLVQGQWRRGKALLPGWGVSIYTFWNSSVRKLSFLRKHFLLSHWLEILLIFVGHDPRKLRVLQFGGHFCAMKNCMSLNTDCSSFVMFSVHAFSVRVISFSKGVKIDSLGQKKIFLLLHICKQ